MHLKEKSPKNGHKWRKSVLWPRQSTMSQVDRNDGKATWIALWIASIPTLFSRSGPQWLLAVYRPQNIPEKEIWLQWRIVQQKKHWILWQVFESVYHPRRLCWWIKSNFAPKMFYLFGPEHIECYLVSIVDGIHFSWLRYNGTDVVRCVLSLMVAVRQGCLTCLPGRLSICFMKPRLTYSSSLRGRAIPQALILLEEARFIPRHLKHHFQGNANGTQGIFTNASFVWITVLYLDSPLKRPCTILAH